MQAISQCIKYFNSFYKSQNNILIINTHGYVTNIGENLLYDLIQISNPNGIVYLSEEDNKK